MNGLLITNLLWGSCRTMSPLCCENFSQVVDNIIKASSNFDVCFIVNDSHKKDDFEFKYLPPHNLVGTGDTGRLLISESKLQCKYTVFLTKNQLSAVGSPHNQDVVLSYGFNKISVAGFALSIDILPTCLDLLNLNQNVSIMPECVGDLSEDRKNKALEYMTFIGLINASPSV